MQSKPEMPAVRELHLFDTCVVAGRITAQGITENACLTQDTILPVLDRHGIEEALVTLNRTRLDRPHEAGNRAAVAFCRISPRLHPVWILEPPAQPGRETARAAVTAMRDCGVRVARLLMGTGASAPLLWWWHDLLEALEEYRIPSLLDFGSTDYSGGSTGGVPSDGQIHLLRDIVLAHPELPMILSHASGGLGIANSAVPLIRRTRNLHLDITGIVDYWRRVAFEVGPDRVFFATGMPYYDPGMLVSNVQYQPGLDLAAKQAICGGNIRRLMEAVR